MSTKKDSAVVTMADLNAAIKPLIEAINRQREEISANGSQQSEILQIVTGLSVKFDCVDQTTSQTLDEISKVAIKKAGGRKPATKKAPAKKAPAKKAPTKKKIAEPVVDDADEDAEEPAEEDAEEPAAEEDDEESKKPTKKPPPKKALVKKAPAKASTKKPKTTAKKAAPRVYKMNLFKEAYTADPKSFNKQLTKDVLNTILAENKEKWDELSGDALETAKINAYFHYVKDNHDDILEELKKKFLAKAENADVDAEEPDADAEEQDAEGNANEESE
jgi:hypothetical protein